jgi:glycosyltransferase involved in cell wall biosynthesis
MKILVVASDFPWPKTQGGHLRLTTAIEALTDLGETDLFTLYDPRGALPALPPNVSVGRLKTAVHPGTPHQIRWRSAWLTRRGIPLEVSMHRADSAARLELESWAAPEYDLVWFEKAATFEWMGRPSFGPTVIDLVDLEDEKARSRAQILQAELSRKRGTDRLRQGLAVTQARVNARDWERFQRSVAGDVERVVLSSVLDVRRSGLPNAVAVPNTYVKPARPVGHRDVGRPPTLLFQATFDYGPNVDAVDWLVTEVAPRLLDRIPDLEIRLVGKPVPGVQRRHRPPAVTVVGVVPAMEPELARADVAIVPVRYGSGTRLKILESFAHRVPVVSTTIGAEGLQVEDGVQLLLADDPDSFAAACERLLGEGDLRARTVDAAERCYLERYERSIARDHIHALARAVAGNAPAHRRGTSRG